MEAVTVTKRAIREAAARFAKRWEDATSEQSESHSFWDDFFDIFGIDRKLVGQYEKHAERLSTGEKGRIDLFVPQKLAVEHKSAGKDLEGAMRQLLDYLPSIPDEEAPRMAVACDFQRFKFHDYETRDEGVFPLKELPDNVERFWWLAGHDQKADFASAEELNLAATMLMRDLHDELERAGYDDHSRRVWLTRVLFCVFADSTAVWDSGLFASYVAQSRKDGQDLGGRIATLFQVLDKPENERSPAMDDHLAHFAYINGDLFAEQIPIAHCTPAARKALLEVCRFNWAAISPAIFGSLFQEVITPAERREIGAHYTSEENIMRVIRPLFLDSLEKELAAADTLPKLEAFHAKLASLTFFDPAAGCGNFLVVAYRELRRLETETLEAIFAKRATRRGAAGESAGQQVTSLEMVLKVGVSQFYGIEIEEFPARIASTALYLADHIANREASEAFGQYFVRFPIQANPHILIANALDTDWNTLLPSGRADYVYGNPPFVGFRLRTEEQKADMARVMPTSAPRRIDYVLGWYAKALDYIGPQTRCAFVSTNSITQGEQASALHSLLERRGATIEFAHRTFAWTSEARGKAHVHVVIVGFAKTPGGRRRLYFYPDLHAEGTEEAAREINVYLVDSPMVGVAKRNKPLGEVPELAIGSKPNDGGNLILTAEQRDSLPEDLKEKFTRRLYGAQELLQGVERWCLWLAEATPTELRKWPELKERLENVRDHRLASTNAYTQDAAATPALFWSDMQPAGEYLAVPEVSSENYRVAPMTYLGARDIATNKLYTIEAAPLWLFGVLQSAMFTLWTRTVGGRLKSDPSISPGSVYNTFPFPSLTAPQQQRIEGRAEAVLDARAEFPEATLADLYSPLSMPKNLVTAHDALDKAVDAAFAPRSKLELDQERLSVLFDRYIATTEQLAERSPRRRRRRPAPKPAA